MKNSRRDMAADSSGGVTEVSAWSPFRHRTFAVLWAATVVSNIGTWMQNAAAGWLMTGLDPDPLVVSLVQVATSLPMFLLGLPAGALADIVDRRRLLIVIQIAATVLVAAFATLVLFDLVGPITLLGFTFLIGVSAALIAPSWQAIVPQLVPRSDLAPAVALNSVGLNISRAIGPALAGLIIAVMGIAAPFWLNAASNIAVIAALIWWRTARSTNRTLPPERFGGALRIGIRHAKFNPHLRATLVRAGGFFLFASAYWGLLPLVARGQVSGGPELYGILLGAIGGGAVVGALALPHLKARLGPDKLMAAGTAGTAIALILFGIAREPIIAVVASAIAGIAWIAALATLNISAQVGLPSWVRGRGLAVFVVVQFGAMSLGGVVWGQAGVMIGLPAAHFVAAALTLAMIPLLWRWKLQTGATVDLSPSMHWPAPIVTESVEVDQGPVLVTIEYRIRPEDREPFIGAIAALKAERRRDGAFEWRIYEDAAQEGRMVETFMVDSWLEHLRQHERVTNADHIVQDAVNRFHIGERPKVTHLIAR